jgi:hypothetical protein
MTVAEKTFEEACVNIDLPINNKSQTGYQILTYLVEHPETQDTLEAIVEWWLLERAIKFQTARVKEALSELVDKGLIIEKKGSNSHIHYRLNQSKYEDIQELFKRKRT